LNQTRRENSPLIADVNLTGWQRRVMQLDSEWSAFSWRFDDCLTIDWSFTGY